jgi:hypothetical protein
MHWLEKVHICQHEAAHAVVAQKMGLPVAWVTVEPGCEEGIDYDAAVSVPEKLIDRERDLFAICVSQAAPYHFRTHLERRIGRYAALEYEAATILGGKAGIDAESIYDRSEELFYEHYDEIIELAQRLEKEGTVTFTEASV